MVLAPPFVGRAFLDGVRVPDSARLV